MRGLARRGLQERIVPTRPVLGPSDSLWWLGLTMSIFLFPGTGEGFIIMGMDKDRSSSVELKGSAPYQPLPVFFLTARARRGCDCR